MEVAAALERGRDLAEMEENLGVLWEDDLQRWALKESWFTDALNQVYLYWHLPVIGIVALWLYAKSRPHYFLLRNILLISAVIGLMSYFAMPVAPPRLLPELGFADTIAGQYGSERPGTPAVFVNHYAAVPSLHFGWNLLAGLMPLLVLRNLWTWGFAMLMPLITLVSIVLTANHFFLDALAGAAAVGIAALIALILRAGLGQARNEWLAWALGIWPAGEKATRSAAING